jgi:unsaturated rhamnogalacturonyl hydrolase
MKKTILCISFFISLQLHAQFYANEIADVVMSTWKDSFSLDNKPAKWSYDLGVLLKGIEGQWLNTGDGHYFKYIQKQIDFFVDSKGRIKSYRADELNIDNINLGRNLLMLYKVTLNEKYLIAANSLRDQLRRQPRTTEGGFWHKKIYPNQMWLDGLYMAEPFYAEYSVLTHEDSSFNDIANQFIIAENHTRNQHTGLMYHGWDESLQEKWANPKTGCSSEAWARAMGWYASALVDVLDWFPENHPKRKELLAIANRLADVISRYQDATSGLWYDVLGYNGKGKEKNYFEASASCQFVYFMAKASRKGYISNDYVKVAIKGFENIKQNFVHQDSGRYYFSGTVKVSGLGNKPYRDGSFDYYMSEPVINNDPKGLGVFLIAAAEMQLNPSLTLMGAVIENSNSKQKTKRKLVMMDNYYNHETHVDAFGKQVAFHYKWGERDNGGYSFVNHILQKQGATTVTLDQAPTKKLLKDAAVYILIDPDWPKENKTPNYIRKKDIIAICDFVKKGGVLLLMANDSNNVEFEHFNELASCFGFKWDVNVRHDVKSDHFETGAVDLTQMPDIFGDAKKGYIKQLCTQQYKMPRAGYVDIKAVYKENDEILMTVARYGKGTVFAVGDPWFYNEYIDGRKLPAEYQNYKAAENLFSWLLAQSNK